jgi:polyketide cyclase/dehydrase/lipid transport protein
MASIHKDVLLNAPAGDVWDAVRDFGALHTRLVPGFVRDTRLENPGIRIVTFANGRVVRERLVDCDEARRRLVYAVSSERVQHYNAAVQVFTTGETQSRLVWIIDLLPSDVAPYIAGQMDQAALAMQETFGGRS